MGYVLLDGDREPTRVRAAYVDDPDITAMAYDYAPQQAGLRLVGSAASSGAEGGEAL